MGFRTFISTIVLMVLFAFNSVCFAQTQKSINSDSTAAIGYIDYQLEPEFPGGTAALFKYLQKHLKYPAAALDSGIQGTVFINVHIKEDGSVGKAEIIRGIGGGCNEAALKAIQSMPKWLPPKINGKPIPSKVVIPVKFYLQ